MMSQAGWRSVMIWTVEIVGTASAAAVILWLAVDPPSHFVPPTSFALFAFLPAALAIVNHFTNVLPRFRMRRDAVREYARFCEGFNGWWQKEGWPRKLAALGLGQHADFATSDQRPFDDKELIAYRPMTAAVLWSAMLLTGLLLIAAYIAASPDNDMPGRFPKLIPQVETATPVGTITLKSGKDVIRERGTNGLLFAALGAYVSILWRMINRINANSLTSRFLFTCSSRTAIAMIIGLVSAQFDLFSFLKSDGSKESVFFLSGLFTDWALTSLRARARTVFNQNDDPCDRLPLCYVDGLDDGVIDILDEIGIWDVEHLATMEPAELTIRTLLPFNRVIDWIDQAILITYIRRDVALARSFGIGGAIDLAVMFGYTVAPEPSLLKAKAEKVLDDLARKIEISREALDLTASTLWCDYTVEQLYRFWQHHYEPATPTVLSPMP